MSVDEFACELDGRALDDQVAAWRRLDPFVRSRVRTGTGFRLAYDPAVRDELDALIGIERGCCSWARWSLCEDAGAAVVEVSGPADEVAALADAFGC